MPNPIEMFIEENNMDSRSNNNDIGIKKKIQIERRSFLKKASYAAPVFVVLGALSRPTSLKASKFGSTPPPPGDTGGWQ